MKLGVFTPVFGSLTLDRMLAAVRALRRVQALELGAGGWPGSQHLDVDTLLGSKQAAADFLRKITDSGLAISAISCHGNPIHPNANTAREYDAVFQKAVRVAESLDVHVVVTFSGCPGDSDTAKAPNWITTPWPPEFLDVLEWQWAEKVIPYWKTATRFAADHGVKVALEAHPGFVVYNADTLLKLRAAVGPNIGINLDPSHFFWQGVHLPAAIRSLAGAIFHVHAKDVALNASNVAANGVIDAKSYRHLAERSWLFRTVGWGHDELTWKQIVSALRVAGYDGVISIEHEDALASVDEGLAAAVDMLDRVILREAPAEPWWT